MQRENEQFVPSIKKESPGQGSSKESNVDPSLKFDAKDGMYFSVDNDHEFKHATGYSKPSRLDMKPATWFAYRMTMHANGGLNQDVIMELAFQALAEKVEALSKKGKTIDLTSEYRAGASGRYQTDKQYSVSTVREIGDGLPVDLVAFPSGDQYAAYIKRAIKETKGREKEEQDAKDVKGKGKKKA